MNTLAQKCTFKFAKMRFTKLMRPMLIGAAVVGVLSGAPLAPSFAGAPPAIELYGTLPKTEIFRLSPNGEMFAKVFTEGDKRLVGVLKANGEAVFGSQLGDLRLAGLQWAGDDYVIVFMRTPATASQEYEYLQATVLDIRERKVRPLLRESADYVQALFGTYGVAQGEDGDWYSYVGIVPLEKQRDMQTSVYKQSFPNLAKINLKTGRVSMVTAGAESRRWVLDEKGAVVARSEYSDQNRTWKILPPNGSDPVASGTSDYGFYLAGLGRTPGTILINTGGAEARFVEIKMDGGAKEDLLADGAGLLFSEHTRLLLGAVPPNGKRKMTLYEPTLARRYASIERAFKSGMLTISAVNDDLSKIIVYVEDSDLPGIWQLVDFKTGQANPVAERYPGIASEMVGPSKMYSYKAADGLAMEGVLTLPPGSNGKNLPVVVMPHGGPEASDEPGFDPWVQVFAARGYAVFQPNYRGSNGYGTDFRNAGFGQWGRKMQTDISDGLMALARDGIVDAKRACIVGASYGGYAAFAGVTVQQGLYRCAASYNGVSDPADMLMKDAREGASKAERRYWNSYLGTSSPSDIPKEISPRLNAAKADAPLLIVYGERDNVVYPEQSKDMASALRSAGKPVELIELKGETHGLMHSATRLEWFKAMVAFVQKYNPA